MPDPVSLTASAIANLAFQKFVESGAGELAKKFTESAIAKMEELRQKIWEKLRGKPTAEAALTSVVKLGSKAELDRIIAYLQVTMDDDPEFAQELQLLAQRIYAGKIQDNSSLTQNNYDNARGFQTKIEGGANNYVGEVRIYQGKATDSEDK
ncbi:hypothetical protein [Nostoc sp.]|uniref:hypothetical protein n=1 Tax=Nostoc sp. TaxID=1180 RepID=UPI002FFB4A54